MPPKRIAIIPGIHGKLTADGKISEPDVYYILEKWLDRHPEVNERREDLRISCGHLSDNDGTNDQHLPLGAPRSGTDWPDHIRKLKATGYDGTITLEVFSPQREHLLLSRDLLQQWWDAG